MQSRTAAVAHAHCTSRTSLHACVCTPLLGTWSGCVVCRVLCSITACIKLWRTAVGSFSFWPLFTLQCSLSGAVDFAACMLHGSYCSPSLAGLAPPFPSSHCLLLPYSLLLDVCVGVCERPPPPYG